MVSKATEDCSGTERTRHICRLCQIVGLCLCVRGWLAPQQAVGYRVLPLGFSWVKSVQELLIVSLSSSVENRHEANYREMQVLRMKH